MGRISDVYMPMVGQRFGRLLALAVFSPAITRRVFCLCQCDCGNVREVRADALIASLRPTRSCGCIQREVVSARIKHGQSKRGARTAESKTWTSLKGRCLNPRNPEWHNYGGRGITVCDHWRDSFEQFFADVGTRPDGLTLDRRDNNKGYLCPICCPPIGNCRWTTQGVQNSNRRPEHFKSVGRKVAARWAMLTPEERHAHGVKAITAAWKSRKARVKRDLLNAAIEGLRDGTLARGRK